MGIQSGVGFQRAVPECSSKKLQKFVCVSSRLEHVRRIWSQQLPKRVLKYRPAFPNGVFPERLLHMRQLGWSKLNVSVHRMLSQNAVTERAVRVWTHMRRSEKNEWPSRIAGCCIVLFRSANGWQIISRSDSEHLGFLKRERRIEKNARCLH